MLQRSGYGIPGTAFLPGWGDNPTILEGDLARRTVRVGSAVAAAAAVLFSTLYAVTGPSEFVAPNALGAVALVLVAVLTGRDARPGVFAAITIALLLFGYELALIGRIDNGIAVWFLVPNIATMLFGLRGFAIYCGTATAVELGGVVVAARVGALRGTVVVPEADLVMAASTAAVLALCGIFAGLTFRARRTLVLEVQARNAALAAALEEAGAARTEAEEAVAAKDRFFANLTHEIRTPLNGIAGTAELLGRSDLNDDQRWVAEALRASTRSLVDLVNAMLDHARLSAGHAAIDLAPVDPRRVAAEVVDMFRAGADQEGLTLSADVGGEVPAWVETDGIKLRQILANLVANAVKFTATGGIVVRVGTERGPWPGDDLVLIVTVADSGVGIAPELLDDVFRPFVQGDASISRAYGGTGLGLAIARQFAVLLGGSLVVVSRLGEGSVFTLRLPVRVVADPQGASPDRDPGPASIAGTRILLVEDNQLNRLVASAMLRRFGADVHVACGGEEALDLAAAERHAVILMDIQMPGMDGIETARRIRAHERLAGLAPVPIVAMSGNSPDDYGEACAAAGMNGFLMKPIGIDELRSALAAHVEVAGRS
jgi:hypothetical protein